MRIVQSPRAVRRQCLAWRRAGEVIALVPTMGALHEGHASLIRRARRMADKVVVSVFVNPTQFGPKEDLARYPRPFAADCAMCRTAGVDMVFAPAPGAMYAPDHSTWVDESALSLPLCGARRPGHFRGVSTVVAKLFMICQPDIAIFGQKDAQQSLVIGRMVRDLDIPVKVVVSPIVRERDGLAMSSRNVYLTAEERLHAPRIQAALHEAARRARAGKAIEAIRKNLRAALEKIPGARVDYVAIVDEGDLQETKEARRGQRLLMAVAVVLGTTRLIDNERVAWGTAGKGQ